MKRTMRLICLVFALLLCLTACGKKKFEAFEDVEEDVRGQTRLEVTQWQQERPFVRMEFLLKDAFGEPLSGKTLSCAYGSEKTELVTDVNGVAELVPDLEPGTYDVIIEFAGDDSYRSAASRNTLTINERINRSGIYVRANEMRNVDLDAFQECEIGHIFLQSDAISLYGEDVVENFISDALERGIKTHMWVLGLFSNGKWVNPINAATGEYNTDYFNEKAEEIHKIAALEGLYGIHFDCIRFEGGEKSRADRYTSGGEPAGEKAVTEFVNTMRKEARLENSALIFSGTLMPDPQESIARYGQDVAALSQYFSFFVPMTYVGIYLDDVSEITAICAAFDEISGDAEIWAGVIGYDSDDSQVAISEETLRSYAEAAYAGNAMGVTLFRYGKADLGVNRGKDLCPLIDLEP